MAGKRATPRDSGHGGVKASTWLRDAFILPLSDYERGCLLAGLSTAAMLGACLVHWAVS